MPDPMIVTMLRTLPGDILHLMVDANGFCLRRMWITKTGLSKTSTIPVSREELRVLSDFVKTQRFELVQPTELVGDLNDE